MWPRGSSRAVPGHSQNLSLLNVIKALSLVTLFMPIGLFFWYRDLFLDCLGISVLRRTRKSDNNRIARACGATVVNRTDEIKEEDVGTGCGLFEVRKIGDE